MIATLNKLNVHIRYWLFLKSYVNNQYKDVKLCCKHISCKSSSINLNNNLLYTDRWRFLIGSKFGNGQMKLISSKISEAVNKKQHLENGFLLERLNIKLRETSRMNGQKSIVFSK